MSSGLRVKVVWDDTTVEDRIHHRRRVEIGEGERARAVAPGCFARARRRGSAWHVSVEPGVVIEAPGESAVVSESKSERILKPPFRSLSLSSASARVELEVIEFAKERSDRALIAWAAAAAILAMLSAGSYKLVRQFGEGRDPQWGHLSSLSALDATRIRVRVGPEGLGSNRPQTGNGSALVGIRDGHKNTPPKKPQTKVERPKSTPHVAKTNHNPTAPPVAVVDNPKPLAHHAPKRDRKEEVDAAEAALLQADLRTAIDSFERAAENGPLDYDELNWLGLSHYLLGELDEAEKVWHDAEAMDGSRPDAINNLASVAKRRGKTEDEVSLLQRALAIAPEDCHALNSLALAQAKLGHKGDALSTLAKSDQACGGNYAYTSIQRSAIEALSGNRSQALSSLEDGLKRVDTLLPIKEFEVYSDLVKDQAFSSLRSDGQFSTLTAKYLPRATSTQKL
jgi:tetratricopeptide (TPR) repeat protein